MSTPTDEYLKLMNFDSPEQAYREVKRLASDLSESEHHIRSCIFDLHAAVEIELRRIVYHTFLDQLFLTDDEEHNSKVKAEFGRMVDKLGFMDMYRILGPVLLSWPYPDFASIEAINQTRNQAAHGDLDKVSYKGRNPFKNADCFAQMYFDVWAIKQEIPKFFYKAIERRKDILKRYIDKYGTDLL